MRNKNFTIFEKKYIFDLYVDTNTNFDIPEQKRKKNFLLLKFFFYLCWWKRNKHYWDFIFLRHCFTAGSKFEKVLSNFSENKDKVILSMNKDKTLKTYF